MCIELNYGVLIYVPSPQHPYTCPLKPNLRRSNHGRRQTFCPGEAKGGGQGAGHVGADISHGRAFDECMDDNWGAAGGGKARARGAAAPLPSPLVSPMSPAPRKNMHNSAVRAARIKSF